MKISHILTAGAAILLLSFLTNCTDKSKSSESKKSDAIEAEGIEHERDEHGEGEGEEAGTALALDMVYDVVRKGTHLIISYDEKSKSFTGTVENISKEAIDRVRIEVHLSNGIELGPTAPVNLEPGEKREVKLTTESAGFSSWSTHAEVGSGEHGHGSEGEEGHGEGHEGGGEHGHEGEGEHGHSHEGESEHH